jgi:chemotaxis protein histidine kinase CheA
MDPAPSQPHAEIPGDAGRQRLRPVPGGGYAVSSTLPKLRPRRRTSRGYLLTHATPAPSSVSTGENTFSEENFHACMACIGTMETALRENSPDGGPLACLAELKKLRRLLPSRVLAFEFFTAFHLLEQKTQASLDSNSVSRSFLPLVLGKCVRDMRHYFERSFQRPDFPWLPKWKFYFDSLEIAGAGPLESLSPASTHQSGTEEASPDPEMLEVFAEEAAGLLESAERALLRWEALEDPEEQQRALRRAWHTLKGAANSLNLRALGQGFHALEDFVQTVDPQRPPSFIFGFLLATLDQTRDYTARLAFPPLPVWTHDWAADIVRLGHGPASPSEQTTAPVEKREKSLVRVEAEKLQALLQELSETSLLLLRLDGGLQNLMELQKRLVQNGNPREAKTLAGVLRNIRADQDQIRRRLKQSQNDLAALNMMPAGVLFRRLQRVFRDAVQQEGKNASLAIEGGETLLDRSVLDALFDPLLHLVRNAVAHGLESNETRRSLGKPEAGRVLLRAVPFSNQVVFEVRDDGAGIRTDKVLARAREKGLVPDTTTVLSDGQALELLFTPGFSTADAVTEVAGRGVGLDAVKKQIEAMNGTLAVDSSEGTGSLWSVTVPLSLSALEILEVQAAGRIFALPLSQVEQCLLLDPSLLDEGRYPWRGGWLPCHSLAGLFELPDAGSPRHGVVLNTASGRFLATVDQLVVRREAILKSLGFLEPHLPWYAGAVLDARGLLLPVLHPAALLRKLPQPHAFLAAPPAPPPSQPLALVVDDSPSVRIQLRHKLQEFGFCVQEAANGLAALDRLEEKRFQLILTDQEMPGMTGLELLRAIAKHATAAATPVVMITSSQDEALQLKARQSGAFAFLPKPPRDEDLQSVLRELHLFP